MSNASAEPAKVLVVDDTQATIDLVLDFLDAYDVIAANCGAAALEVLASEPIDLVLLDIVMPEMDGLEVCRRIRSGSDHAIDVDIPIIFLTAQDDDETIDAAYSSGADDYVTKPVHKLELLARIETQLQRRRQFLELTQRNQQLDAARRALAESEERHRLALDASNDGLWDWDMATSNVHYSPGWMRILGEQDAPERYETWGDRIHPDDRDRVLQSLHRHLASGHGNWQCEHRLRHADGHYVWVNGRGRVVKRDASGRPLRMVGTMIDVGERVRHEQVMALRQQLSDLVYSSDMHTIMRTALDTAEEMTGSEIGFYHFVEDDEENISLQVWSTRTLQEFCYAGEHEQHYPVSKAGIWADCIHQRRTVVHNDYANTPGRKGMPTGHPDVCSELTVPVIRDNRVVAVMGVGNKRSGYDAVDAEVVERIAAIAHDVVERQRIEERIKFMAFNDPLTGLPNKELLYDRISREISSSRRRNELFAICYLDLDGFKPVNDRFGHHIGDALLVELSRRLTARLREGDTLARLGGDEFVLLLSNLENILDGEQIVARLLRDICEPFSLDGCSVTVTASIGMTYFPSDNADAATLIRHADKAMYKVKEAGRAGYWVYDPVRESEQRNRLQLLQEFQQALTGTGLMLHYQPRIDLRSGDVVGAEALLRWMHPRRGLLLPGAFLELVQGRDLEYRLGEWVIRQAASQFMAWRKQGLDLPISINISIDHLVQPGFSTATSELVAEYPGDVARNLEFEVLESADAGDSRVAASAMEACAKLGIRFALDDFGTGYASLSRLHNLPVDLLKIDQRFVRDMLAKERDLRIVEGVLRLAGELGTPVVAEGVESIESALILLQLGCQYAQGFGIARPMPADDIPVWVQSWSSPSIWRDLAKTSAMLPGPHDFGVAVFAHQYWLQRIEGAIVAGDVAAADALAQQRCTLDAWYRGIGQARYGAQAAFPFVPPRHARVHELAHDAVRRLREQDHDAALKLLAELRGASQKLLDILLKLRPAGATSATR